MMNKARRCQKFILFSLIGNVLTKPDKAIKPAHTGIPAPLVAATAVDAAMA